MAPVANLWICSTHKHAIQWSFNETSPQIDLDLNNKYKYKNELTYKIIHSLLFDVLLSLKTKQQQLKACRGVENTFSVGYMHTVDELNSWWLQWHKSKSIQSLSYL